MPLGRIAAAHASALGARFVSAGDATPVLVIRSGDSPEARAAAAQVCAVAGKRPVLISTDQLTGMAPWLFLRGLIPVFAQWLAPGERKPLPEIPGSAGPVIVLTGPDGDFEADGRIVSDWRLEVPTPAEREELWSVPLGRSELAHRIAFDHRHTAGRIAALAAAVHDEVAADKAIAYEDIQNRGAPRRVARARCPRGTHQR